MTEGKPLMFQTSKRDLENCRDQSISRLSIAVCPEFVSSLFSMAFAWNAIAHSDLKLIILFINVIVTLDECIAK